jgi:hypothetical protein
MHPHLHSVDTPPSLYAAQTPIQRICDDSGGDADGAHQPADGAVELLDLCTANAGTEGGVGHASALGASNVSTTAASTTAASTTAASAVPSRIVHLLLLAIAYNARSKHPIPLAVQWIR